ncbi:solute carrier family 12 member 6-like [Oscarella lobularis]|uniref:solute carrier family 12 member 6-like n=1 Tax=Oscarella lobularis TaxID=121494 RepID=UPI003313EEE9
MSSLRFEISASDLDDEMPSNAVNPSTSAAKTTSFSDVVTDIPSSTDRDRKREVSEETTTSSSSEGNPFRSLKDIERSGDGGQRETNLALFEDEMHRRPKISTLLSSLARYDPAPASNTDDGPKKNKATKMGTLMGVYLPTIQNILGVILFLRMTWIVGMAGVVQAFFIVAICCCCTLLTAISMSAIATNGVVPAGGAYFMISRALGPEFGGAVGLLFYLGTTFAGAMYILGAVELLVTYIAPAMKFTDDLFNNMRVYGTVILILLTFIVFVGVKYVNYFASVCLAAVIISIFAIYVGIFVAGHGFPSTKYCTYDGVAVRENASAYSCKNDTELGLFIRQNNPEDRYHDYVTNDGQFLPGKGNNSKLLTAVPGLGKTDFTANSKSHYLQKGQAFQDTDKAPVKPLIVADITSSFAILLAIFFPSVTGIMAGSNRSGDLKDAQRSIPRGTIAAILTTTIIYLTCVLFFGGTIDGPMLRDKFGESIGSKLVVGELTWPSRWVIYVGAFLSTIGAGLQSLTGAPRLLQAIARDNLIPILGVFAKGNARGEPTTALFLTAFIAEVGVLIASLDLVAPIITMFFLMCYGFVNLACTLQSLLKTPNWRPRFRYYHWVLSLTGVCLCVVLMFISSWYYALAAIALAIIVYKYIEYRGAEKEWGDGLRGLALQAARYSLLRLEEGPPHTKNWRPQILFLTKLDDEYKPQNPRLLSFSHQLKAGKGLTIGAHVLQAESVTSFGEVQAARQCLYRAMKAERIKGFSQVIASPDLMQGISSLVQNAGLGGLSHNTVLIEWPDMWKRKQTWKPFIGTIREVAAVHQALLVMKGGDAFPSKKDRFEGTIDVWWIVHDGGMLMLLPFLLRQHKVWKKCRLRIFTVAQMEDNSIQMKRDLTTFLYQLRIEAEVDVIEMLDSDISAYTYERTLIMEERTKMLQRMQLSKKERKSIVDDLVDASHETGASHSAPSVGEVKAALTTTALRKKSSARAAEINEIAQKLQVPPEGHVLEGTPHPPKPTEDNVRRMNTSVKLNEIIMQKSHDSKLVVLNLPGPPSASSDAENYMEFLEVLTEGLDRVLMVRGGGREVVTIYS